MRIAVYCASSTSCDAAYHTDAWRLGEILGEAGHEIVYGGGAVGSMGSLADGALTAGGQVTGILPEFMHELEWGHTKIQNLQIVEDMRIRKHLMLTNSDAVVSLPGGSGTLEELLEALTLKRLGIYVKPIVLLNTRGFYDRFVELIEHCVGERFMGPQHRQMWVVANTPEDVLSAIDSAPPWGDDARRFAAL